MKTTISILLFLLCGTYVKAQPGLDNPADTIGDFYASDTIGCVPLVVNFNSGAFTAVGWNWDFGNGNTSTLENPVEVFNASGNYTITLEVTYSNGTTEQLVKTNWIEIVETPNADFTVNNVSPCLPNNQIEIQNNSTGGNQFVWDFGDSFISTEQFPVHTYTQPGNYTINLVILTDYGCMDNYYVEGVEVFETTSADIIVVSSDEACDTSYNFQFQASDSSMLNYSWSFGDGDSASGSDVQHVYGNYGTYDLTLITEDNNGCVDTTINNEAINLFIPEADFTVSSEQGCVDGPIDFSVESLNATIIGASWNFGDSTTGEGITISHSYQDTGTYSVMVIIEYSGGCFDTLVKNDYVTIEQIIPVQFELLANNVCLGDSVISIQNVNEYDTYWWSMSDGNTYTQSNFSHLFTQTGDYEVNLVVTSGACADTTEQLVHVSSPVAAFETMVPSICLPVVTNFTDQSEGAVSWSWDFGNGDTSSEQNPTVTYLSSGDYLVKLVVVDSMGCSDSIQMSDVVSIPNNVPISFEAPVFEGCSPMNISLLNVTFGNGQWNWNFGDGVTDNSAFPEHNYTQEGTYAISLSTLDTSGCMMTVDTFAIAIVHNNKIDSLDLSINCDSNTLVAAGNCPQCTEWSWNFGDGTYESGQEVVHYYDYSAIYYVSLTGYSEYGCVDNRVYYVDYIDCIVEDLGDGDGNGADSDPLLSGEWTTDSIFQNPTWGEPVQSSLEFCAPYTVSFYNPRPNAQSWVWEFGDGSTDTSKYPVYTYSTIGQYSLKLTYDSAGIEQSLYYHNFIDVRGHESEIVVEEFSACDSLYLDVVANDAGIVNYFWNIDNAGGINGLQHNNIVFPGDGNLHIVTLTTTDTNYCNSSTSLGVMGQIFYPDISVSSMLCLGEPLVMEHNIENFPNIQWNFGDGNTSSSVQPNHIYQDSGLYNVSVIFSDTSGCEFSLSVGEVNVVNANSSFVLESPESVCIGDSIVVSSLGDDDVDYTWNVSNADVMLNSNNLIAIANAPGDVIVSLTTNVGVCSFSNTDSSLVVVHQAEADFSFVQNNLCLPVVSQFTDQSNAAVAWEWDFGDGNTSTDQNPVHSFAINPTEEIQLSIEDINGCMATISMPNIELFHADFDLDEHFGCAPAAITFSEESQNGIFWKWNFGDGEMSILPNPSHVYNNEGVYSVSLIVYSADGCSDTIMYDSLVTVDKVVAEYTASYGNGCAPQPVFYSDASYNAVSWSWEFGNGFVSTAQNPIQIYYAGGEYSPVLVVESESGCVDTATLDQSISILGPAAGFVVVDSIICFGETLEIENTSINADSYLWLFGDGDTSTVETPTHTYTAAGGYTISLICGDVNGCQNSQILDSAILIAEIPSADFAISDTIGCDALAVELTSLQEGDAFWYLGDSLLSQDSSFTKIFVDGFHEIRLEVESQYGCVGYSDTAEVTIHVTPSPTILMEESICETEETINFQSVGTDGVWYVDGELNANQIALVVQDFEVGAHEIVLEIPGYCPGYDTATFYIDSLISIPAGENFQICEYEDEFLLSSLSAMGYWEGNGILDSLTGAFLPSDLEIGDNVFDKVIINGACEYRDAIVVTVNPQPVAAFSIDNIHVCAGDILSIQPLYQSDDAVYEWEFINSVDTILFSGQNPDVTLNSDNWKIVLNIEENQCENIDSVSQLIVFDTIIPSAPNIIRSTVLNDEIVFTEWTVPSYGKENVLNYQIWRSVDSINYYKIDEVDASINSYDDFETDVMHQNYFYIIKPTNVCGPLSTPSEISSSILLKNIHQTNDKVILMWSAYEKWEDGVDYYEIFRLNDNGNWDLVERVDNGIESIMLDR